MSTALTIGLQALQRQPSESLIKKYQVRMVRNLDDFQMASVVRSIAFIGEQACPYEEEFDGNDLTATHLLAFCDGEPIATLRLRWFASFGKVERVCVTPKHRGSQVVAVLLAHAFEFAARKGYRVMIAQIQARLWPLWSKILNCQLRESRPSFYFSDFEYFEIEIPLRFHPHAIRKDTDPHVIIRPEGQWDQPGVLDASVNRTQVHDEAA